MAKLVPSPSPPSSERAAAPADLAPAGGVSPLRPVLLCRQDTQPKQAVHLPPKNCPQRRLTDPPSDRPTAADQLSHRSIQLLWPRPQVCLMRPLLRPLLSLVPVLPQSCSAERNRKRSTPLAWSTAARGVRGRVCQRARRQSGRLGQSRPRRVAQESPPATG